MVDHMPPFPSGGLPGGDGGPGALNGRTDNPSAAGVTGFNSVSQASGALGCTNAPFGSQPVGVFGRSDATGVLGLANQPAGAGVYGGSVNGAATGVMGESTTGSAVRGQSHGSGFAGEFIGTVHVSGSIAVTGDIFLENGGDMAERFALSDAVSAEPGTVMCVADDDGGVAACTREYDSRVVGVVSGAGSRSTAVTLRDDLRAGPNARIALAGTVYCLADATAAPIQVGDPLTTSSTPGHAMKAASAERGFGAVIGKALQPLADGRGPLLMLIRAQ